MIFMSGVVCALMVFWVRISLYRQWILNDVFTSWQRGWFPMPSTNNEFIEHSFSSMDLLHIQQETSWDFSEIIITFESSQVVSRNALGLFLPPPPQSIALTYISSYTSYYGAMLNIMHTTIDQKQSNNNWKQR